MSKKFVKVSPSVTLKEAIKFMHDGQQKCILVVDDEDFLEGILTYGDIRRYLSKKLNDASLGDSTASDVIGKPELYLVYFNCFLLSLPLSTKA